MYIAVLHRSQHIDTWEKFWPRYRNNNNATSKVLCKSEMPFGENNASSTESAGSRSFFQYACVCVCAGGESGYERFVAPMWFYLPPGLAPLLGLTDSEAKGKHHYIPQKSSQKSPPKTDDCRMEKDVLDSRTLTCRQHTTNLKYNKNLYDQTFFYFPLLAPL